MKSILKPFIYGIFRTFLKMCELRTPLNVILGLCQVMTRDQHFPSDHQKHLDIINRNGEHLLLLINQVLELSRIESGRLVLNEHDVDIFKFLDDLEDMLRLRAEKKGLFLMFELHPEVPQYVKTDEIKLRQVLLNLLSNAIKFTQKGGVTLRVKVKGQRSRVKDQRQKDRSLNP